MANIYKGHPQPEPNERLAQIKIFLADEDYHRTLQFTKKLAEIVDYVKFLERNEHEFDERLLQRVKGMIFAHTELIKRATRSPSTSYFFTRYNNKNRLLHLVRNKKRRAALARVKAPKLSQDLLPGPALHKCLVENERPSSPDPFLYTKQLATIRHQRDAEVKRILDHQQNLAFKKPIPTNFNGPYTLFYNITHEDVLWRKEQLSGALQKLSDAAKLAPRPFIQEVIEIITHSMRSGLKPDHVDPHEAFRSYWNTQDVERLLVLAQPSWSSDSKRARQGILDDDDGDPKAEALAQLVKFIDSAVWRSPESYIAFANIYQCMNEAVELNGTNLATTELETMLKKLNDVGFIRYNANSQIIKQPVFDRHPENPSNSTNFALDSYRASAKRMGISMAHLERISQTNNGYGYADFNRDMSSIHRLRQQIETKFPLPITDTALSKARESFLSEEQSAELLQQQVLLEHHYDWDDRTPNFQNLWSFASSITGSRQFFTLNRWPPELQNRKRRNEILDSGPTPQSPKQSSKMNDPVPKENETIYRGETFFPFGETRYQAALLSQEIELGRPDGPVQRRPLSDPYALPPIPEIENKTLLDYARRLGLSMRKRKRGVDDIIPEEMLNQESQPNFMPETIGGVRILVAEAPLPKRRRATKSATTNQVYQKGSGYEDVEYVKPGKQLDWDEKRQQDWDEKRQQEWQSERFRSQAVTDPTPIEILIDKSQRMLN